MFKLGSINCRANIICCCCCGKKINFFTICGLIAGSYTNAPPLAYATSLTDTDEPAVAYSTVYPLATFLRILFAQMLVLLFA